MPDIFIYDIGTEDGQTSAMSVANQLAMLGNVPQLDVYVTSRGGSVYEALGIYTALKDNPATVVMHVTVALSSGTFVVMAGDEIEMAENGIWMVHRPTAVAAGNEEDMENAKQQLAGVRASVTKTYADRTKLSYDQVTALMNAQTWMTAEEAKAKGFVDRISPNKTMSAQFDLSMYAEPPEWVVSSFKVQAKETKMDPVNAEIKPGMSYRLGPDGKVVCEPVASAEPPPKPPVTPVVTAPAVGGEPVMTMPQIAKLVEDTLKAGRDRDREITAVCNRAGVPQMAFKFIDDPKVTVEMVKDEMLTILCVKNVPVGAGPGADPSMGADPVAKYKAEFASALPLMQSQGITEEVYVRSRKHTDGIK